MRVLVVGAGIAGLSTALRLRQLGVDVTVAEQAEAERGGGYMIDFFGPGIEAAHQLSLDSALRDIHAPVRQLRFVDPNGRQRFAVTLRGAAWPVTASLMSRALGWTARFHPLMRSRRASRESSAAEPKSL